MGKQKTYELIYTDTVTGDKEYICFTTAVKMEKFIKTKQIDKEHGFLIDDISYLIYSY